jgi:glycosyltransferase involved in cell wall biosynthesis
MSRRVLVLTPFPPHRDGQHGGSRAMAGSIGAFSEHHQIGVLSLGLPHDPPPSPDLVRSCAFVETVARRPPPLRAAQPAVDAAIGLGGVPAWVRAARSQRFAARVAARMDEFRPDVVQAAHNVMGQYLGLARDAARVVVFLEPGSVAAADRLRTATGTRRVLRAIDARAWRSWEAQLIDAADAAIAFTPQDRATLLDLEPHAAVHVIPLGTDVPPRPFSPVGAAPPGVLFVGNFVHAPNREAALRLVTDILPRVRRRVPELPASIVGPAPPAELLALADRLTSVTGAVESLDPYMDRAAMVVAPIWTGGGMRVKVLEALAAGKALVATPLAVEGLDVRDGEQLLVAETAESFADAIVALAVDAAARERIAAAARRWATENLSWSAVAARYEAVWDDATARRAGARQNGA